MGIMGQTWAVRLRRQAYAAWLAMGLAGLLWFVWHDAESALVGAVAATALPQERLTALTEGAVMDGFGSWSPDGRQIAFMRDGQVAVMLAAGGEPRLLTRKGSSWDTVPVWRPDGKSVAFVRLSPEGEGARIMLADPQTGVERELVREQEAIGHLAWAPDGRHLYYTTAQRIMRLDAAGGRRSSVLQLSQEWDLVAGGLAITSDGQAAVFGAGPREERGVRYDLWRLALTGQAEPEQLTRGGGIMPALDPAGRRLTYRNPRQRTGIYVMDLTKHTTERVVADGRGVMYFHPRFSPDGQRLLISRLLLQASPPAEGRGRFTSHLFVHRLAGSGGQ